MDFSEPLIPDCTPCFWMKRSGRRAMFLAALRGEPEVVPDEQEEFSPTIFEVAAWPSWRRDKFSGKMHPRAASRAVEALTEEKQANAQLIVKAFRQRFGIDPVEVVLPRRKIAIIPVNPDDPIRKGFIYYHDVAVVAFG